MSAPTKQEILKEGLDEIRAENRLVAQRRIERQSDFEEKMLSLPEGRGPFYSNRAMHRKMIRNLKKIMRIQGKPSQPPTMHIPKEL